MLARRPKRAVWWDAGMAMLHQATLTPTKAELIAAWLPGQPWFAGDAGAVRLVGAYRFDDPAGEVGIESHLVEVGGRTFHVPLTYRGAPLDGAEAFLVGTMEHSVLGRRWVYDAWGTRSTGPSCCESSPRRTGRSNWSSRLPRAPSAVTRACRSEAAGE